jgi:DNA-binding protein H-NS
MLNIRNIANNDAESWFANAQKRIVAAAEEVTRAAIAALGGMSPLRAARASIPLIRQTGSSPSIRRRPRDQPHTWTGRIRQPCLVCTRRCTK